VGVLPFALGGVLAWRHADVFRWEVCGWGVLGVVLVMLATYYAGEYWDYSEDSTGWSLTASEGLVPSRFAGGSRVVQRGLLPRRVPLWASLVSVLLALVVGGVLQFGYRTGPWTLPLGLVGLAGGFFYSTRPVRWVSTGLGELWIAFCYGWLPVATGCYLQLGEVLPVVHWMAIPIGLTICNVILLNEFPDVRADAATGKANLLVRLGPERGARLYGAIGLCSWVSVALSTQWGVPKNALWIHMPVLALSAVLVRSVWRGRWRDRATLERLCAATLVVNLATTAAYILAAVWWGHG
jgi:1,4-dihydroxy-2-naphthoate octaprenyltransferase